MIKWLKQGLNDLVGGVKAFKVPTWRSVIRRRELLYRGTAATACCYFPSGIVLDVGTGAGRLPLLINWTNPSLFPIGIDVNDSMLRCACKSLGGPDFQNNISTFIKADVHNLPFPDCSFDMVISMMSIYQWNDRQRGCNEIYRVLKHKGIVLIMVGGSLMRMFNKGKSKNADSRLLLKNAGFNNVITVKQSVWKPTSMEFFDLGNQSVFSGLLLTIGSK
jgi:ubiquinone/menaquinone biosynthesis C-methylase UbiE